MNENNKVNTSQVLSQVLLKNHKFPRSCDKYIDWGFLVIVQSDARKKMRHLEKGKSEDYVHYR